MMKKMQERAEEDEENASKSRRRRRRRGRRKCKARKQKKKSNKDKEVIPRNSKHSLCTNNALLLTPASSKDFAVNTSILNTGNK
jgi:hypothetical protein